MTDYLRDLRDEGQTLTEQVAETLREAIASGDLNPGDRVPGENKLIARFGVNRYTAREALKHLIQEGLITVEASRGTFVRTPRTLKRLGMSRYARSRWKAAHHTAILSEEASAQGLIAARTIGELGEVEPPVVVAEKLRTAPGEKVWVRRRTIRLEDRLHQLADSYYPLDVVAGTLLTKEDSGSGGDFACLARADHEPSEIDEEWTARMPTKSEAVALSLPSATPVLELTRTIYDQNGRPVEVMLSVVDASAIRLDYRFSVPD